MPTREDAERLQRETENLRKARLERERVQADRKRRHEKQQKENAVREENDFNLKSVQWSTRRLDDLNGRLLWFRAQLDNLDERNVQFKDIGTGAAVGHLAMVAGLGGCIIADTIILSTPSRIISRGFRESLHSMIGNADWTVPAVAALFATSYFAAEFGIGFRLTGEARSQIGPISDRAFAYIAWLTLPLLTFAYTLINTGILSNDPFRVIGPGSIAGGIVASVALGLAALVVHGFVLYFGGDIALGFAFLYYEVRQFTLRFQINRTVRQIARAAGDADTGFRRFVNNFRANSNGNGHDPGPFSETTMRVINDLYGREVIEEPDKERGGANGPDRERRESSTDAREETAQANGNGGGEEKRTDSENEDRASEEPGPPFDWEDEDELR